MKNGHDYMDVSWRTSETVSFLQDYLLSPDNVGSVFSNDPEAVYIHTGYSVQSSPEVQRYCSGEDRKPISALAGNWPDVQIAYLVWFENTNRPYLFEVNKLRQVAEFSEVARFEDGTVFRVSIR